MADLQSLVARALSDADFAKNLLEKPEATLRGAGVEPTQEMIEALKGVDVEGLKRLASAFDEKTAA